MLSTLFGKKQTEATEKQVGKPPWDEQRHGVVSLPIWRTPFGEGRARFAFGFSRPLGEDRGYARSFKIEHLWDILRAMEELSLRLSVRHDVSREEREIAAQVQSVLDQALALRNRMSTNGHSEPTR